MIVLDASAALVGLLASGEARATMAGEQLAAPHLVDAEIVHVLRRRVQRQQMAAADATGVLRQWSRLGVSRVSTVAMLDRVWALRENVSAYDATYLALAEALGCALVTADARLAAAPGPTCRVTVVRS